MPANRYRSRSYKRVYKNTPGGENVLRYKKKKPSKHVCAECGKLLHGVPRGRPYEINKLAKSHKRPNVHMVGIYAQAVLVNISKTRLENNDNYCWWTGWNWNHNNCRAVV